MFQRLIFIIISHPLIIGIIISENDDKCRLPLTSFIWSGTWKYHLSAVVQAIDDEGCIYIFSIEYAEVWLKMILARCTQTHWSNTDFLQLIRIKHCWGCMNWNKCWPNTEQIDEVRLEGVQNCYMLGILTKTVKMHVTILYVPNDTLHKS